MPFNATYRLWLSKVGFLFQDLKALFRLCMVVNTSLVIQGLCFGDLGGREGTNDSTSDLIVFYGIECVLFVCLYILFEDIDVLTNSNQLHSNCRHLVCSHSN